MRVFFPLFAPMIYSLDLSTALLLTGFFLLITHAIALAKPQPVKAWLRGFPRSMGAGFLLLLVVTIWAWMLIYTIDLGEFTTWRVRILWLIPVVAGLTLVYVNEFLAVRALGMLALLVAEPLLESAWMRPESGRLLLVGLAYVWIVFGLFWIGSPYTLRDQIAWVSKTEGRWKSAAFAGIGYGVALLILTLHR